MNILGTCRYCPELTMNWTDAHLLLCKPSIASGRNLLLLGVINVSQGSADVRRSSGKFCEKISTRRNNRRTCEVFFCWAENYYHGWEWEWERNAGLEGLRRWGLRSHATVWWLLGVCLRVRLLMMISYHCPPCWWLVVLRASKCWGYEVEVYTSCSRVLIVRAVLPHTSKSGF